MVRQRNAPTCDREDNVIKELHEEICSDVKMEAGDTTRRMEDVNSDSDKEVSPGQHDASVGADRGERDSGTSISSERLALALPKRSSLGMVTLHRAVTLGIHLPCSKNSSLKTLSSARMLVLLV